MTPRVAVTTTPDRAPRVAAFVEDRGLVPVTLPCIRVEPGPEESRIRLRASAPYADWIVVTSPRAVHSTWPGADMPAVPVAVVGEATAEAVRTAGGRVELVGTGGAAALADLLSDRVAGATVVFPHARAADPATVVALVAAGADVVASAAYETIPVAPGGDPVDAVLLGSPSALEGWLLARSLDDLAIAVMGETTADAVRAAGWVPHVVPAEPSLRVVVDALASHLLEGAPR